MGDNFEQTNATTREFTLEFLGQITDNFSEERVIGRGGYGVVYKGVLENGEEIALKKLNRMPGLDDTQFRNEFNHLMRAQHPNITRLVGYCYDLGHQRIKHGGEYIFAHVEERVLCFEYLQGGSLDKYITDESCGLDWHTRFKIIKGVCDGLDYLHNGCKDAIYHLDLKPSNILLDKDMVPKIGDFGLSRLFPSTKTYVTIKIIGTLGYMPPEYIERYEITSKHDVFSLGVIIIRIMAGDDGYSKCANMPSQEFLEHVHDNWGKRMQETMSSHTSDQVETCIKIALRCVEVDREKRPTIAEIVDELNKLVTAESSLAGQVTKNQKSNSEHRGRIVFSTTCRHPQQFDIFSCSFSPSSNDEELQLTDGVSYNYNGRSIPPDALKTLLKIPKLAEEDGTSDEDIDAGHVSGLIFVSERDDSREILYIALRFSIDSRVKVFSLADIFGTADFSGTRLEDSGCIIGGYNVESRTVNPSLIYVSTKEVVHEYCNPWTAVYKTNLLTGKTERLTPQGVSDLSPSVSPSGKLLAVASLESKSWNGEIENLKTNIYVMNMDSEEGLVRKLLIENGGWPSWGSDNIIFFHRATSSFIQRRNMVQTTWGVFRYNISTKETVRVTSKMLDAVTPAAISETKVAVATIRRPPLVGSAPIIYRHIEIFDMNGLPPVHITQTMRPESNHYNPFVLDGGGRIGYHRCRSGSDLAQHGDHIPRNLHRLESPVKDVGLFRVSGVFPAISKDGSKLAFIDNEFKAVWIADSQGLRIMYETREPDSIFSHVWNQNPDKDILYVCISTSTYLHAQKSLEIYAISNASGDAVERQIQRLTYGGFNNAFPSSNPDGNKFVFQSTRDFFVEKGNSNQQQQQQQSFGGKTYLQPMRNTRDNQEHKNLYIMHNTDVHGSEEGFVTRLTKGSWTDTHCQWSPRGDWVAFSSTRDKPGKNSMSLGSFSVYLVKAYDPVVVIKLINGLDGYGGHVDYPVFSPYGRSIAVTMDLAAVSVDRNSLAVLVDWNSLPMSMHREQPYGDIFVVDIDLDDNKMKSKDVKWFRRITHSRHECSALAWTFAPKDPEAQWNIMMLLLAKMEGRQAATSSSLGGLSDLSLIHNLQP